MLNFPLLLLKMIVLIQKKISEIQLNFFKKIIDFKKNQSFWNVKKLPRSSAKALNNILALIDY